jgi:hypothetical protein
MNQLFSMIFFDGATFSKERFAPKHDAIAEFESYAIDQSCIWAWMLDANDDGRIVASFSRENGLKSF